MVAFAYRDVPAARFRAARTSGIVALLPAAERSGIAARFLARASGFASLDAARHGIVGGGTAPAFVAGCCLAALGGAAVRHGAMPAAMAGSAWLAFGLTLSRGGRPHRLLFVREGRMLVRRAIGGEACRSGRGHPNARVRAAGCLALRMVIRFVALSLWHGDAPPSQHLHVYAPWYRIVAGFPGNSGGHRMSGMFPRALAGILRFALGIMEQNDSEAHGSMGTRPLPRCAGRGDMPALITHHLFGEESIDRLPAGIIGSDDERMAFLLANQGPDPFFFRVRTPHIAECMGLAQAMHRCRISQQFAALRDGVSHLRQHDAQIGRAFALGMLSHYVLDRNAHPFVYAQQWGVQEVDETLEDAGSQVHAIIESDLDVLMLQIKRGGATTEDCPPACELVTTDRINKVAGTLMSHTALSVFGLSVGAPEYGGAVADMKLVYQLVEPANAPISQVLGLIEGAVRGHSLLASLAHRVTTEPPLRAGNMGHLEWENPFTRAVSFESFPEVFDRALDDYEGAARAFVDGVPMEEVTNRVNYSGRPLADDEELEEDD